VLRPASIAVLALFALLYGWVAFSFTEPGVLAHSVYCPWPVVVGVDFYPHYIAGHALRQGLPVYANLREHGGVFVDPVPDHHGLTSRFTYPPPVAWLFAPLSRLAPRTAWKIRLAGAVAGMTLVLALLGWWCGFDARMLAVLAAAMLVFYPLHFLAINGNIVMVCLVLTVCGLACIVSGRAAGLGAALLALGAAVKLYPGIFLVAFAVQVRWRLAVRMTAAGLFLVALTWRGGLWWTWLERAREFDRFEQVWYLNGSLFSVLVMGGVTATTAHAAAKVFGVALIGLALWWSRRPPRDRLEALYQAGVLSLAIVLAPTTVYDYNLPFVLPVAAAALWDARRSGLRAPLWLIAASFAAMCIPSRLIGDNLWASKFPWVLLFFAATSWRYLQLSRPQPGSSLQTGAAPDA